MDDYSNALSAHLKSGAKQDELATAVGKSQAAISRYASGARFPDADTARAIEVATAGLVDFSLWQSVALRKMGIAA